MTIFVDASALVAIAVKEPDAPALAERLRVDNLRLYCGLGAWEASVAIARIRTVSPAEGLAAVDRLIADFAIQLVPVGDREARLAVAAQERYGRGSGHPAQLNFGDCFSYACAKANDAKLLYKGNDFVHTDLA